MSDKITTAEQAAQIMFESGGYEEFVVEHVAKSLQSDPENLQSWLDWFNKEGEFPES